MTKIANNSLPISPSRKKLSNQKQHKYYQLVPGKIMDRLLEIEGMKEIQNIPGYRRVYLLQILSIIAFHTRKDQGATALMTSVINKAVPQGYECLRALLDTGIIQRLGNYKTGESSYKYRFEPAWDSRLKAIPLTDAKLLYRLSKQSKPRKTSKKYPDQNKYIRQMNIESEALSFIENIEDDNKFNAAMASIYKILNRDIFYSVDSTSGRYHSNLTNLPGYLREFITIQGQHLVNIDLKNSQPYLSTLLLTDPGKVAPFAKDRNFAMFAKSLESIESEDITKYKSLVISGQIYEYLMLKFADHGLHYTRSQVKKQFFIILFARNTIMNKQRRIFAKLFPMVHERFAEVRGDSKSKSHFQNSKRFAILLQAVESHLILGRILPRIYAEYPGVIAVSIHDSVCTSVFTSDIETVKKIMIEELTDFVRLKPTLKTEKKATEKINGFELNYLDINNQVREENREGKEERSICFQNLCN